MQASDDALDFFDSLLVFDHIYPFALEQLPIMSSRRVFDVGLGVLKHKDGKRNKSLRSHSVGGDGVVNGTSGPNQDNALVPRHKKSNPNLATKHQNTLSNDEPVILPPPNQPARNDFDFPLPPSKPNSPENNQSNGDGERSLQSSHMEDKYKPERRASVDNGQNFDLKPPPPRIKVKSIDTLSEQLFSGDHLRVILQDPSFFLRFTAFLNRYRPQCAPTLVRYLESQKAMKAVAYANALAETIRPIPGESSSHCPAASIESGFKAQSDKSFDSLINEALPAYVRLFRFRSPSETFTKL